MQLELAGPDVAEDSAEAQGPYAAPNLWPSSAQLPDFRPTMMAYMEAVAQLSDRVRRHVAQALHLPPDYFDQFFRHPLHQLRILHYTDEESSPADGVFGAGAHSDWGFITFLVDDGNPGLQLLYQGKWADVPPVPNTYIVNVGDMLEFWSNGLFKSTRHRVVKPKGDRYSCAFFVSPDHNAKIECLPTCQEGGAQYDSTTVADYLSMKYKKMQEAKPATTPMES